MSWSELHSQSEKLAIDAQLSVRNGETENAVDLYKRAAKLEQQALEQLDISKGRTRGITAVSAVALWYKGGEYALAENLAYALLADSTLPAFAQNDLRTLVQAIWTESSKKEAGVTFIPGQVQVSVQGGDVVTGGAPLDLIVDKIKGIQSMFYRTIEFLKGDDLRQSGHPSKEIQEACRPWLFQSAPGSYQFSVAIQKPQQMDLLRDDIEPEEVARHFMMIIESSSSRDEKRLKAIVPDDMYRSTFLKLARNLAPTGKSYERIEFRAPGEIKPVTLAVESRNNINQQIRNKASETKSKEEIPSELRGTLRALHLDKHWLDITVDNESVHVTELQDTVDDVIGPMVNREVIVHILRLPNGKYKYVDIELAE